MLRGSITALITPMHDGVVDEKAFSSFVEWQLAEGTHGLVPVGTTGESPTVSHEEHRRVVEICIEVANGRVPVVAGAGSNSTAEAVALAKFAEKSGANAVLSVVPYYNKPNQEGLFQHFSAIASAIGIPVVLYSVPGRTIVDLSVDTIARLHDAHANIIGVKDATGSMERATMQRNKLGKEFILLSGDDSTALGFNAHGGHGCISVTSNVAPRLCAQMQELSLAGDFNAARDINDKLAFLHKDLFMEPNPAPAKYVANRLNLCANEMRLPLTPISKSTQDAMDFAMRHAGLI
ncbi:4-hydroxy-tetrahydrodipicolinate synthase [Devosia subaequoris]|uniref:4-hydroxy-tetrahydrodipicolinate synthase n=1 Tax=Devosia subaequoris TaxID=395930 RepID=A0A7W6IJK4_9HYPH|nr:4-hydroxy-tetrahydrodipicolinate synthase [Devosia subaequoris]MBB4050838.1 4-hydroxy-tetrahydrodipicolinate synthase [Devosia subaequoris]MCP1208484.1 4-hydroxy-tetrahydrodipicolinate synthase [Devosia subaequoris]